MEERVRFASEGLAIEGMLERRTGSQAVVITHPHPLYGGDMDNPVVLAVRRAFAGMGISTLRFNFRGTGGSAGRYGEGRGERQDVKAALAFLAGLGMTAIDLAGYSFGAWVNAGLTDGFARMLMVSPPVAFIDFAGIGPIPGLALIVTGDRDEIAPAQTIARLKPTWNPAAPLEVVARADHFFTGHLRQLEDLLTSHRVAP
jgi:hypothetical protein